MNHYAIRNVNDAVLAWSNTYGWIDNDTYDTFTEDEKTSLQLPIDGEWWQL